MFQLITSTTCGGRPSAKPNRLNSPEKFALNAKELVVLAKLTKTSKQIRLELGGIPLRTVESHVQAIIAKLQANNRTEALVKALRQGIIKLEDIEINELT